MQAVSRRPGGVSIRLFSCVGVLEKRQKSTLNLTLSQSRHVVVFTPLKC